MGVDIVFSLVQELKGMDPANVRSRLQSGMLESASAHPAWKFSLERFSSYWENIVVLSCELGVFCEKLRPPLQWAVHSQGQRVPFLKEVHHPLAKGNQPSCFILYPGMCYQADGKMCSQPLVVVEYVE